MASWAGLLAISGFRYHGGVREVSVLPAADRGVPLLLVHRHRVGHVRVRRDRSPAPDRVLSGTLPCRLVITPDGRRLPPVSTVRLGSRLVPHVVDVTEGTRRVSLAEDVAVGEGQELVIV